MTIIAFNPRQNKSAIEELEEALERVKSGDITAVSLSWTTKNETICGTWSTGKDNLALLASMENTLWHFKEGLFRREDQL